MFAEQARLPEFGSPASHIKLSTAVSVRQRCTHMCKYTHPKRRMEIEVRKEEEFGYPAPRVLGWGASE